LAGAAERTAVADNFRRDGADGDSNEKPFRRAPHKPPNAAAPSDAQGSVAFPSQGGRLGPFVGEVAGGSGQAGLVGVAIRVKVLEAA
jgi:hypothetical protein